MKMLTIRQPWASLIALGVKTIETRSWSTPYRGPIAIHAGASLAGLGIRKREALCLGGGFDVERDQSGLLLRGPIAHPYRLPLGAVVAVADLVDIVPIVRGDTCPPDRHFATPKPGGDQLVLCTPTEMHQTVRYSDQLPFGDFTPGRHAWLLDNVRAIDPIPTKGHQGLRDVPADLLAALETA